MTVECSTTRLRCKVGQQMYIDRANLDWADLAYS